MFEKWNYKHWLNIVQPSTKSKSKSVTVVGTEQGVSWWMFIWFHKSICLNVPEMLLNPQAKHCSAKHEK